MLESTGQAKLIRILTKSGWHVTKVVACSRRGFPDLLCLKAGCPPLLIECKTKTGKLAIMQRVEGEKLKAAGATVVVVDVSSADFCDLAGFL
jgi:Holliday junction resolvase